MKELTFLAMTIALAAASTARAECANADLPKVTIGRTPTYVSDNTVYLAARPRREDFRIFAVLRVDTVIDLTGSTDPEAVRSAGLRYLRVPFDEELSRHPEALGAVMEAIGSASRDSRVLVCDDDGELTGALWTLVSVNRKEVLR